MLPRARQSMGIAALHAILRRGFPVAAVQVCGFADKVRSYEESRARRFASKLAPTKSQTPNPFQDVGRITRNGLSADAMTADNANALSALRPLNFQRNVRALRLPRSGGLVELEFQGLSDMDVARALSGQGWPVSACP
ncbi:MAG: hypothetical protein CTR55_21560 [Pseudomonas sp.]|nr:MAG: hypothetical protein CTR55_21560 [Pseudomonas sp.]